MDGAGEDQQEVVQTSVSDDTAHSSLSWEEEVSYHWLTNKLTLTFCDVCGVRYDDHEDIFRFVAFHAEEGSRNADTLADLDVAWEARHLLELWDREPGEVTAGPLTLGELNV
ncbi:hypothetical protein B484DRAFT_414659 [Ochromonadaceae sp. CCMP2298]|nr:hypothetical protein B484DRAFT_414659 [Ochromonadaceae sp. CCMP2298]